MKSKGILILLILMTLSLSLNFVVATDMNATLSEQISTNVDYINEGYNDDYLNLVNVDDEYQINENPDSYLSSESSKVIYVGNNSGVGEGSFDNPYPNFKSACDNVNGEDNVTINVFAGTYYLGEGLDEGIMTPLRFNVTSNLNIVGNGTVIIKNYFDNPNSNDAEAFSLVSGLANVTFSDIIFDSSSRTVENYASDSWGEYQYFVPFYGETNLATFNNCSFEGSNLYKAFSGASFNSKFVNCCFDCIGEEDDVRFVDDFASNTAHVFEYCIVNFGDCIRLKTIYLPCNISFENVWFGQNTLPQYITPPEWSVVLDNQDVPGYVIPVSRYAVFDVTENYLGNDQFEIVGKLTWNGTSDQDGMENFQPMTVTLVSDTGDIGSTVSLVNGNFRTVYTSSSDIHRVNATLHNQLIPLEFTSSSGVGESSKVIYVGQNVTADGGNGSFDNPFRTFKLACDNVNGEDNVTINVFAGTYYLGEGLDEGIMTPLRFNVTSNLNIVGNGTVIIKNYFDNSNHAEAFSLVSGLANVTFSDIIFDSSSRTVRNFAEDRWELWWYFVPFYGETNLATFNNCSFVGSKLNCAFSGASFNSKFVNCYFDCKAPEGQRFVDNFVNNTIHVFEYCIVNIGDTSELQYIYLPCNISFENVWFGQNTLPRYITPPGQSVQVDNKPYYGGYVIPVSRYAVFNVTENYLGNNLFEIVGKLTWNGTSDQDGMENFEPMIVTLVSDTGDIDSSVNLVNGNFRTVYTSHSSNNLITATLHNQPIELEFTTVNITADSPVVKYAQDQNITINFSQAITANVTLTVSNESYKKVYEVEVVDNNSICYTIPDILK